MTYEEIKTEARRLPVADQLRLIEEISSVVRERLGEPRTSMNAVAAISDETWGEERARLLEGIPLDSPIRHTFGMLRTATAVPTDAEIEADYTDYLIRKYA